MSIKLLDRQGFRFSLFLFVLILLGSLGKVLDIDLECAKALLLELPVVVSGIVFISLYVLLTMFIWAGPKDFFRVSGALVFGPYVSALFVWIAETINAAVLFHLSRRMGRGYVEQRFGVKTDNIDMVQQRFSMRGALVLRINPLVPFRFMDLGYGLTRLDFQKYLWVVIAGSPVRILWLQLIIAGVGLSFLKDTNVLVEYLRQHPRIYIFNLIYMMIVMITSLSFLFLKLIPKFRRS